MGGGSSSSKNSNSTKNVDESINLNSGGFVATGGSNINVLDGGAVEGALKFGDSVAENAFSFGGQVIESYEGMAEDSLMFAESSLRSISSSNAMTVGTLKELAENLKAGETSGAFRVDRMMIYSVLGLVVISVLLIAVKGRK